MVEPAPRIRDPAIPPDRSGILLANVMFSSVQSSWILPDRERCMGMQRREGRIVRVGVQTTEAH